MKKIIKKIAQFVVRGAMYLFLKIVYKAEIKGLENIPKDENVLFCGNHRNYVDPPLILSTAKKDMRFIAKIELRENPWFKLLGIIFDAIYVKRDSKDIGSLKETLKALNNGDSVALFPEGTRNASEKGEKAKDGAAFFAVKSGVKVIPCGIKGGMKKWDKVTITYGKPLDFSEYTNSKDKEALEIVTGKIMEAIQELAK